MFLILRLFNSILFVVVNLSIALYTLQRFFRAMKAHYLLIDEVEQFTTLVDESRASLNYVGTKVMEAMKEMELDIGKEVYVTHHLTKLSAKVATLSKRFSELEEGIIELARLSHNMGNATVETPPDINDEVRRILLAMKRKTCSAGEVRPQRSPRSGSRKATSRTTRSHGAVMKPGVQAQTMPSPVSKFSAVQSTKRDRSRSPKILPEVMLLNEQRSNTQEKPIGFRPPWMCQV